MSPFNETNLEIPKNLDQKILKKILDKEKESQQKVNFPVFYTKEILHELYYIWKTYNFTMVNIVDYIKEKYSRSVDPNYLKKKLIKFENTHILNTSESKNKAILPQSDISPIKEQITDSNNNTITANTIESKRVKQNTQKKIEDTHKQERELDEIEELKLKRLKKIPLTIEEERKLWDAVTFDYSQA